MIYKISKLYLPKAGNSIVGSVVVSKPEEKTKYIQDIKQALVTLPISM